MSVLTTHVNLTQTPGWLVDTHCHLDFESFDSDRDKVFEYAASQGVVAVINPGLTLESSINIVRSSSSARAIYPAVGVHPNEGGTWNDETEAELRKLAKNALVVAIGEIGLDYYWLKVDPEKQKKIFEAQLNIAGDLDLPVIIHNRDATEDIISVLHKWVNAIKSPSANFENPPGVLHSFSGNLQDALRVLEMGFMIGIGGPVTFRNAPVLVEVVREVPIEHIVVETDSPFLSPHPFRGQRNEPGRVRLIAEKIAEIKGLTYTDVCAITTGNAARLFRGRVRINHG